MGLLVIHHKVKNFVAWKPVYDGNAAARKAAGFSNDRVLRSVDDPNDVTVIMEFAELGKAKAFVGSADLKSAMQRAGVIEPVSVHFLDKA